MDRQPCAHGDLSHFPLREISDLLQKGQLSPKQAREVFRRVNDRYQNRDVLTDGELDALREFRDRLTDAINPYTIEELDRHAKKLNEKIPDWEHWYTRCGTGVIWHDRPRSP